MDLLFGASLSDSPDPICHSSYSFSPNNHSQSYVIFIFRFFLRIDQIIRLVEGWVAFSVHSGMMSSPLSILHLAQTEVFSFKNFLSVRLMFLRMSPHPPWNGYLVRKWYRNFGVSILDIITPPPPMAIGASFSSSLFKSCSASKFASTCCHPS